MAKTLTPNYSLSKWDDGDNPGAAALNANWTGIDTALRNTDLMQQTLDAENTFLDIPAATTFDLYDLAFFSHNSLMPSRQVRKDPYDFPATDFSNIGGGTITRSMSVMKYVAPAANTNFGWDMGASFSKVLMILGNVRVHATNGGIGFFPTLPSAVDPTDGYLFVSEPSVLKVYKRSGGVYTSLTSTALVGITDTTPGSVISLAAYVNGSTNRLVLMVRFGAERWFPVLDFTDASFSSFRYAGVFVAAPGGGTTNFFGCPMGIWAE